MICGPVDDYDGASEALPSEIDTDQTAILLVNFAPSAYQIWMSN